MGGGSVSQHTLEKRGKRKGWVGEGEGGAREVNSVATHAQQQDLLTIAFCALSTRRLSAPEEGSAQ